MITVGTLEMIIDGFANTHRALGILGPVYNIITISGEIFAGLIILACFIFIIRRYIVKPKRFIAPEMKPKSRKDATIILSMIALLMFFPFRDEPRVHPGDVAFCGLWDICLPGAEIEGFYPVTGAIAKVYSISPG